MREYSKINESTAQLLTGIAGEKNYISGDSLSVDFSRSVKAAFDPNGILNPGKVI